MTLKRRPIGFVGGGNMAEALIKGLLSAEMAAPADILFHDPNADRRSHLTAQYQVRAAKDNGALAKEAQVVVLAVKPQYMDQALSQVAGSIGAEGLVISVAAGVTIETVSKGLKAPAPVIRAMPNTPALIGRGAAVLAPAPNVAQDDIDLAVGMFEAVGLAVVLEEKHLDAVTGLSGSGPAYVFTMLEALADGAVRMGLPRKEAGLLAAQTVMGAAQLALETGEHTGRLKDMVVSPGGTTAAGLFALETGAFRGLLMSAVESAARRSIELGGKKE